MRRIERHFQHNSGRLGFLLAVVVVALVLVSAWILRRASGEPPKSPVSVAPATNPLPEAAEPVALAEPRPMTRRPEVPEPAAESRPVAQGSDPQSDFARKYQGMSKDRLQSALRDTVAAVDARARQVLIQKSERGESEVVDKGLNGEIRVSELHPGQPVPIAGRARGKTGSTAVNLTTVRPGDDPLLDSLMSEADWIRIAIAEQGG